MGVDNDLAAPLPSSEGSTAAATTSPPPAADLEAGLSNVADAAPPPPAGATDSDAVVPLRLPPSSPASSGNQPERAAEEDVEAPPAPRPPQLAECRICLQPDSTEEMVQPCVCHGTLRYAHVKCLKQWVRERSTRFGLTCEVCKATYADSLLPELQPEAAARLEERRQRRSRNSSGGIVIRSAADVAVAREELRQATRLKCGRLMAIIVSLMAVVGVLLVLGMLAGEHLWAAIALRILAFGIPVLIIAKAVISSMSSRR